MPQKNVNCSPTCTNKQDMLGFFLNIVNLLSNVGRCLHMSFATKQAGLPLECWTF